MKTTITAMKLCRRDTPKYSSEADRCKKGSVCAGASG